MDREDIHREASMLVLPLLATALVTQGIEARFDNAPDLTIGQRIRVSFLAPAPPLPIVMPSPRFRVGTAAGTLIDYQPLESIVVRRDGWVAGIGPRQERTFNWVEIMQIEVAQPRNAWNVIYGATGGFVSAVMFAVVAKYLVVVYCGLTYYGQCPSLWKMSKDLSLYLVPLGAVVGIFSTRWKPVYHYRQAPQE